MWSKVFTGKCRWCRAKGKLNGFGRCDKCNEHYSRNKARGPFYG